MANYLVPFGGGVSMCPGRHVAKNEIKIFVALLLYWFDLRAAPAPDPTFEPGRAGPGILPPASDVQVTMPRRV